MIDVSNINAQLFTRAATDADGAALRALLGAGAAGWVPPLTTSIIPAHQLAKERLPQLPLLVWRRLPISGENGELRLVVGIWYVYDQPSQGYWRIGQIATALQALYIGWAIAFGELTTSIGGEQHDDTLGLLVTPVRVSYSSL